MPCDLPVEIVLTILELAAHSELEKKQQWVLGLCSLSKAYRPTMIRILYSFVVIRASSGALDRALHLARLAEPPFTHTKVLLVCNKTELGSATTTPLAPAFSHVVYVAGHAKQLAKFCQHLRPQMVFITDGWDEEPPRLQPLLEECTHLHMTWSAQTPCNIVSRLAAPRLTHVIVDVAHDVAPGPRYQLMEDLLRSNSLRRVLYRTAYIPGDSAADFAAHVQRFAISRNEPRIFLDDHVVPHDEIDNFDECDIADVRRGRELWLTGRQLYTSIRFADTT
ncbi:hypothetical protein AURDEDRAFT_157656 [Auricularia subglabra TFB-10046 SS5]|nr:hypothetical protein AURDEDRAFT_157656 [Auricularia subglabra TFB-10046 SS5]